MADNDGGRTPRWSRVVVKLSGEAFAGEAGYGIDGYVVDGMDVSEVYAQMKRIADKCRATSRPAAKPPMSWFDLLVSASPIG